MSALDSLMEMGFPKNRAEKALAITGNQGVAPAMEWLFAHADDADIDEPYAAPQGHTLAGPSSGAATGAADSPEGGDSSGAANQTASSLKCDECGKALRDATAAQTHASRTGHSQFSESVEEIKPLTEEEKAAQKALLVQRMQEKRKIRAEQEKQEDIEREKMRRKSGKDITDAKSKYEMQQRMRDADLRRREMAEAKKAKDAITAKVAADKAARAAAKAQPSQAVVPQPAPAATAPASSAPPVKKEYTDCRLRVRLPDGKAVMEAFSATAEFSAVAQFVRGHYAGAFVLKTTMPAKTFGAADMSQSLKALGLVPSATLMVIAS
ncbi:UBX domain-containing protein 1-like [Sycon ciliatum]|uniref:UBX domain-containing protein 1-like n=1 Tax=Sycon ciliatum TaxID=27933 RepID=UPI0020AECD8C|eukprot:scpid74958/ scgid35278/ UBX domain-containing protein 1; SAPK substrate protein 1